MIAERITTLKAHGGPLYALAPGRNPSTLFSAGGDRIVAEWDLTEELTNPFGIRTDGTIYSILNIDRKTLLIGTNQGSIHVIDLESKKELRHLKFHDKGIFHLNYSARYGRVYAACADGSVSVWEVEQWSLLWHLELSHEKIRRIAFNADESQLAVACGDGRIHILLTEGNRSLYSIEAHKDGANSIAFLPNGDLVSGGKDAYLRLWSAQRDYLEAKHVPAHNYAIYDIVVDPKGQWIATASRDKTVKIWDMELKQKPIRLDRKSFDGHTHSVNGMIYLEEEGLLASCSDDRTVVLWKIS